MIADRMVQVFGLCQWWMDSQEYKWFVDRITAARAAR
jgi:hypothetical protein